MKFIFYLVAIVLVSQSTSAVKQLTRDQRVEFVLDTLAAYNKQTKTYHHVDAKTIEKIVDNERGLWDCYNCGSSGVGCIYNYWDYSWSVIYDMCFPSGVSSDCFNCFTGLIVGK